MQFARTPHLQHGYLQAGGISQSERPLLRNKVLEPHTGILPWEDRHPLLLLLASKTSRAMSRRAGGQKETKTPLFKDLCTISLTLTPSAEPQFEKCQGYI